MLRAADAANDLPLSRTTVISGGRGVQSVNAARCRRSADKSVAPPMPLMIARPCCGVHGRPHAVPCDDVIRSRCLSVAVV